MKKEALLFIFSISLILSTSPAFSQKWVWATETKPSNPKAEGEILMDHSIALDNKGNTYAIGLFLKTMIFGTDTLTSYGPQDLFLVKYNANGKQAWVRQLKEDKTSTATGKAVATDDSGNAYVTGMFSDTLIFGATKLVSGNGSYDAFIAKYYANGNLAWAKQINPIGAFSSSFGYGIAADHSGNIYMTGLCGDTISYESDTIKQNNNQNFYLAKLNSAGHVLWMKSGDTYDYFSACSVASIAIDQAGNPYIAGIFEGNIILGKRDTLSTPPPSSDLFVAKYDPAGNVLWASSSKAKNGSSYVAPCSVSVDGNGDAYVTGYFHDTISFGPDMLTETKIQSNAFISRFSGKNGNVLWGLEPQSAGTTLWQGFSVTSDTLKRGGCYIVMQGEGKSPYKFNFGNDTFKLNTSFINAEALVQFDSSGHVICGNIFTEGSEDDGDGIVVNHSGKLVYLGGDLFDTTVFGPDTLVYGYDMPFVACWQTCDTTSNTSTATNEMKAENAEMKVYPNPFHSTTTILVNTGGNHYMEVYDVTGRKLQSVQFSGKQYELSSQGMAQGMYFIRVFDGTNSLIGTSKIVVQ